MTTVCTTAWQINVTQRRHNFNRGFVLRNANERDVLLVSGMSGRPNNKTLYKLWDVIHDRLLDTFVLATWQALRSVHSAGIEVDIFPAVFTRAG